MVHDKLIILDRFYDYYVAHCRRPKKKYFDNDIDTYVGCLGLRGIAVSERLLK